MNFSASFPRKQTISLHDTNQELETLRQALHDQANRAIKALITEAEFRKDFEAQAHLLNAKLMLDRALALAVRP